MPVFDILRKPRRDICWSLGIFILLMLRACVCGMEYWPQLDDYIQLHNYAQGFSFPELCRVVGVHASRPLAAAADYYIWSPLFDHMILGVAIISALYALCVVLMKRLIERYFPVGPIFCVVMGLLPLGIEGTYWVSASGRIVPGILFACLAAMAFGRWLDRGEVRWAALFAVGSLIPFGFYEQCAVLAMTLVLGMALLEPKRWRRGSLAAWVIPAAGLYLSVSRTLSASGAYAGRTELALPNNAYYWETFLPDVLGQMETVFLQGNFYTLAKGALRSLRQLLSGELLLWTAAVLVVSGVLFLMMSGTEEVRSARSTVPAVLVGVLLAVAPLTPFLVLANPWFSMRGAVASLPGLALICDTLAMAVLTRLPGRDRLPALIAAGLAFLFCFAGASEVADYRDTTLHDQKAARAVLDTLSRDMTGAEESLRVGILGLESTFLPDMNFSWHEHIHGCTESSWAFSGLLTCLNEDNVPMPQVFPLPSDPIYRRWNAGTNRPWGFDLLYLYRPGGDGSLIPVTLAQTGELAYDVLGQDGQRVGRLWEESDGLGYFRAEG